ncbi:MAG: TfuA-like protein [Myxococcota bacterium]
MLETVVFLGPSLDHAAAGQSLDVEYREPIRRGDLPQVVARGVRRIGIIDGEFGQSLSVSVAEIRRALAAGVEIWGSSSMGALRAAECECLGMHGVGWIFEAYRDGTIEADDEVALLFEPRSRAPVTVPLVNLRWGLALAHEAGLLSNEGRDALLAIARALPFEDRCWEALGERAAADPDLVPEAEALLEFVTAHPHRVDRKRLDALALLHSLRDAQS